MNQRYHHTQIGYVILAALALTAAITVYQSLKAGVDASPETLVPWMILGIITAILALFSTLTVTIDDGFVTASFGPGLISRKIALADIGSCQAVRNHWYNGWGIRVGIGLVMFNVSGLDAVELRLKDGSRFRIGTDEPELLANALKAAMVPTP